MKRSMTAVLGAVLLAIGGAAQAAPVVYDNGAPNQANGNEMSQWIQTEDFTIADSITVTDIHFWSVDAGLFDGSIVWQFYADAAGQPAAAPFASGSVSGGALTRAATGNVLFFGTEFENSWDIAPLLLGPGTYHLGLHNGALTNTTREEFYWETTGSAFGARGWEDEAPFGPGAGQWFNNGQEHAFQLTGSSVPEPATIALLGLGLAGLGFSRRRQAH